MSSHSGIEGFNTSVVTSDELLDVHSFLSSLKRIVVVRSFLTVEVVGESSFSIMSLNCSQAQEVPTINV